jgi:DNA gyrase/topoisomerase IV subunit B
MSVKKIKSALLKRKQMGKDQIKVLDDREWLLIRGHNIIGSLQPVKQNAFLYNLELKKFKWREYEYIPGLVKIINEIIDNSLDVAIKSNFKYANQISVDISGTKVVIQDNGYGIPVEQNEEGKWLPEIAWGQARAGSNFDDDEERSSIGMNGIGSFATTVFSKKFIGITDDGKKRAKVIFKNNAAEHTVEISNSQKQGTQVTFYPDLEKFNISYIDELHQALIFQRLLNLSIIYPEIKFKFNKRLLKIDAKKFLSLFSDSFEFIEEDNYLIAVIPNNTFDFNFHTYVNGLWLEKGGNHINFISSKIVDELRQKLVRRYKSIKPGDIKNKLTLIAFFRDFKNPKFDSQTKEFLTNTQKEITSFLRFNEPEFKKDWDRFINKIYKDKTIIEPITDLYNAKMLIEEKKKLKQALKKQDMPTKYWPATKKNKFLFLAEGDSAIDAIISEISRDECGFFPLKGIPLNPVKDKSKVAKNTEIKEVANILGIDLTTNDNKELTYETVVIASDMDVDGSHVAGILLGLFMTYTPSYLDDGKIFRFITPLVTIKDKKGNYTFVFNMDEYEKFRSEKDPQGTKYIYDYKKGLGSMEESEWHALFQIYTVEDLLMPLHLKESDSPEIELNLLQRWLSDDSEFRKEQSLKKLNEFDINKV